MRRKTLYIQPTDAAITAAKKGLEARKKAPKSKKGGLDTQQAKAEGVGSGVARARDIIAGKRVNAYQVKAFFDRHRQNYIDAKMKGLKAEESRAIQAWLIWGGEPLRKQAEREVAKHEKILAKENPMSNEEKPYLVEIFRGRHAGKTRAYKTLKAARRACDKLDLEYGAICCNVKSKSGYHANPIEVVDVDLNLLEEMALSRLYEQPSDGNFFFPKALKTYRDLEKRGLIKIDFEGRPFQDPKASPEEGTVLLIHLKAHITPKGKKLVEKGGLKERQQQRSERAVSKFLGQEPVLPSWKNPKKSTAKQIIAKCQKLWEIYCKKPSATKLRAVAKHCEVMKESKAKSVKNEYKRCIRSVKAEAKSRGWKI